MAHIARAGRPSVGRTVLRWWRLPAALVGLVAAEGLLYSFIKSKGVSVTGDEPHYLIAAKALTHLSVHPLAAYKVDLRTHQFYNWPAGSQPTNLFLQLLGGPHGPVSTHSLGLSALLAPFVAFGGGLVARLGLVGIEAAGFIYFFVRAANLSALNRLARVVFAVVLASPAIWLAGTQIYPDLLTGILMAAALVDVIALESRARLDGLGTAVSALSLALLPWLHQQNLVPAALILVTFAAAASHARAWWTFLVIGIAAATSWLLLLAYNLYEYGHPLGPTQPFPSLNKAGITEMLGLLFDRHQGLFVQVPLAALGLVGLWLGLRIAPVAVMATLVSAASLIYLNGTFYHAPYGGLSFAGRFQWASLVPILLWCPFVIASFDRSKARLWGVGLFAAALWMLESVPIVRGEHSYYNQLTVAAPWDPSTYPGWWGGVGPAVRGVRPGQPALRVALVRPSYCSGVGRSRGRPRLGGGPLRPDRAGSSQCGDRGGSDRRGCPDRGSSRPVAYHPFVL